MNAFNINDRTSFGDIATNSILGVLQHDPRCATAQTLDWDRQSLEILSKSRQQVQS